MHAVKTLTVELLAILQFVCAQKGSLVMLLFDAKYKLLRNLFLHVALHLVVQTLNVENNLEQGHVFA